MLKPERIHVTHEGWTAEGSWDRNTKFRGTYVPLENRSPESHNHQFAELNELFETLPEAVANEPWAASSTAFRKHALIETGHCDVSSMIFGSKQEASEFKRMMIKHHGYVQATGGPANGGGFAVVMRVPHSQSMAAMGKAAFQKSKQDVLDWAHSVLSGKAAA